VDVPPIIDVNFSLYLEEVLACYPMKIFGQPAQTIGKHIAEFIQCYIPMTFTTDGLVLIKETTLDAATFMSQVRQSFVKYRFTFVSLYNAFKSIHVANDSMITNYQDMMFWIDSDCDEHYERQMLSGMKL
ncbi:MAG: hypothetical protein EBX37_16145, partial [Alphaproteobacteria bacterium]|nr:hypothetical protein [Alphaproteobacteria bacterium]